MGIWKQLLGQLVRFALMWLFGILVSHHVISADLAARLTDSAVGYVVLFILFVAPVVWGWMRLRFSYYFVRFAHRADPEVPLSKVKSEVLEKVKGTLPV